MAEYTIQSLRDIFIVKHFSKTISGSSPIANNTTKFLKNTDFKDSNDVSVKNTSIPNYSLCGFSGFNNINVGTNCVDIAPSFVELMCVHNKGSSSTPSSSSSGSVTLNLFFVRTDCLTEERLWQ